MCVCICSVCLTGRVSVCVCICSVCLTGRVSVCVCVCVCVYVVCV